MTRDELVRKYLAVKAHMAAQQEKDATSASNQRREVRSGAGSRNCNINSQRPRRKNMFGIVSDGSNSDSDGSFSEDEDLNYFREMRGRSKSHRSHDGSSVHGTPTGPFSTRGTGRNRSSTGGASKTNPPEKSTAWVPFRANLGVGGRTREDRSRAQVASDRDRGHPTEADLRRKQRVACLKVDIPKMGIADLRLLMQEK